MATQAEINAALAAELAARPGTSREALTAYAQSTYGLTPEQINTAYAALGSTGATNVSTGSTNVSTGGTASTATTNAGLLTPANQNLNLASQIKTYTDDEVKQALRDLSWLEPNASIKDVIAAAQTYGIDRNRTIQNLSSFTYTTKNVDKLAQQILAQNTTATWKGDVKPETAARYMADDLAKSGITDISQVGRSASGIVNKETGAKLVSGYGERTKGNLWSGSYEGNGNTGFGVQFTDDGKPMFYTEGASSSTLKKDLVKAALVAGAVIGLTGPEALSGIFGSSTAALTGAEAASFTTQQLLSAGMTQAEVSSFLAAGGTVGGAAAAGGLLSGATNVAATTAVADAATGLTASQLTTAAKLGLTAAQFSGLLTSGGQTVAGLMQQQTSKEAAVKAQGMIDTETAAAKQAAAFRPVGMTTRFGTSQFTVDPVTGQLTSAGYTASPGVLEAQNRLVALGNKGLAQAESAQEQFAPLQAGATSLFNLGNKYLAQTPQDVAQNYLAQQMALLNPGRELEFSNLQTKLRNQGRLGLSVSQGGDLGATTPELQALYNARARQDAELAANAQQLGQRDVLFGSSLLGQGAQTMGNYYGGQQQAYTPYTTALGQVQNLETLAQQPFQMGAQLGTTASTAGYNVGRLGLTGAGQSVALATGADATRNPYASAISGLAANPAFGQYVGGLFSNVPPVTAMSAPATTFGTGTYYGNQDLMSTFL